METDRECTWGEPSIFFGKRGEPCSQPCVEGWSVCELHRAVYQEQARVVRAVADFIRDGGGSYRTLCYDYIKTDYSQVLNGGMEISNYVHEHRKSNGPQED